ncbi:MAG: formylglycine-generating enzyme family protein [Marinifilum sp.]|jgi:formylglycine-generating enzyme required for sulfatase activity|nr:formylglycine-generating enzyme family protein [Marinifilum sp.]
MKQFSLISAMLIIFLFVSCSKDDVVMPTEYGKLSFNINTNKLKHSKTKNAGDLSEVTHAIVSIKKGGSVFQDYDLKKIKVSDWGSGKLVSDEIKLWVGSDYELVRFELQNKDNKTLYAAPLSGSALASKVKKPLALAFSVEADKTTPLQVEVLSTAGADPSDFGFVQFNVKVVSGFDKEMVLVNGGTYKIVVPASKTTYKVTLDDYYIAKYEVTQEQWLNIMGTKPKGFIGGNYPVNNISKAEALEFIKKLNEKTGENYRLPTEAEWLFAARGGNKSKAYKFAGNDNLATVAWYEDNSSMKVHPVGEKLANELGLYDMTGNVWEWCADTYDRTGYLAYDALELTNPKNEKGNFMVSRGGAFDLKSEGYFRIDKYGNNGAFWKGSNRNITYLEASVESIGFRLVKDN